MKDKALVAIIAHRGEAVLRGHPLTDSRWVRFVGRHSRASIFHTPEWLKALQMTYGYEPVFYTFTPSGRELESGLLFCWIDSWLTGRRVVSLPFSDHCDPLMTNWYDLSHLRAIVTTEAEASGAKYIEIRSISCSEEDETRLQIPPRFCLHRLDLRRTSTELFSGFHKDCVQRKIHRAVREGLTCEEGSSPELLQKFYRMQILTRRRQQLPPQPFAWFRNLSGCMGDRLKIRVASKDGNPVASILTLQHRSTLVYKYGCSDKAYSNLGGMQLLFWRAILDAKSDGLTEFDLGRSDWDNPGLIQFKDRLGAKRSTLTYWRYPASAVARAKPLWQTKIAKTLVSCLPDACLVAVGNLLYRHVG